MSDEKDERERENQRDMKRIENEELDEKGRKKEKGRGIR